MVKQNITIKTCDECGNEFFEQVSPMSNLCPNFSHQLYGYEKCVHELKNGRCQKCGWNGNISEYLEKLEKSNNGNL